MVLSNNAQAALMLVSMVLVSIGAVPIVTGISPYVGFALMLCGAVGIAIKEYLGSAK
jgi:hypothetical protein